MNEESKQQAKMINGNKETYDLGAANFDEGAFHALEGLAEKYGNPTTK